MVHDASVEATLLLGIFSSGLPQTIDGRKAITEMKLMDSKHWRKTEWIGFYPEFWFEEYAMDGVRARVGPTIGNVTFDIEREFVWDLKAHSNGSSNWAPLNDLRAVEHCIATHGGIGFLVLSGDCEYDDEEKTFKRWHERLQGGPSDYSKKMAAKGKKSRRRKVSFSPKHFLAFRFESLDELQNALAEGWIRDFQEGMPNSGGSARKAKFQVNIEKIPDWAIAARFSR